LLRQGQYPTHQSLCHCHLTESQHMVQPPRRSCNHYPRQRREQRVPHLPRPPHLALQLLYCRSQTLYRLAREQSQFSKLVEEIEVFDASACWLYTGTLDDTFEPVKIGQPPRLSPLTVCKIWVFAESHGFPALGNTAIDDLHEQQVLVWCTPGSTIRYLYKHTKPGSRLCLFLQDSFSKMMSLEGVLSRDREEHTVEFFCMTSYRLL
jgi:hypothetical protein